MTENLQETEIKVGETGKMVYIGPNIQGLLSGTVFDYMPEIENYKEYESIEKLFGDRLYNEVAHLINHVTECV